MVPATTPAPRAACLGAWCAAPASCPAPASARRSVSSASQASLAASALAPQPCARRRRRRVSQTGWAQAHSRQRPMCRRQLGWATRTSSRSTCRARCFCSRSCSSSDCNSSSPARAFTDSTSLSASAGVMGAGDTTVDRLLTARCGGSGVDEPAGAGSPEPGTSSPLSLGALLGGVSPPPCWCILSVHSPRECTGQRVPSTRRTPCRSGQLQRPPAARDHPPACASRPRGLLAAALLHCSPPTAEGRVTTVQCDTRFCR